MRHYTFILFFFVLFLQHTVSASLINFVQHANTLTRRQGVLTFPSECQIECESLVKAVNCGSNNQCACSIDIEEAIEACQTCVQEEQAHEEQMSAINSLGGGSDSGDTTTDDPETTVDLPNVAQYQQVCSNLASAGSTPNTNTNVASTNNGGSTGGSGSAAESSNAALRIGPPACQFGWVTAIGSAIITSVMLF